MYRNGGYIDEQNVPSQLFPLNRVILHDADMCYSPNGMDDFSVLKYENSIQASFCEIKLVLFLTTFYSIQIIFQFSGAANTTRALDKSGDYDFL